MHYFSFRFLTDKKVNKAQECSHAVVVTSWSCIAQDYGGGDIKIDIMTSLLAFTLPFSVPYNSIQRKV